MGEIVVDGCDACGGLWFDADELSRLAKAGRGQVAQAEEVFEPPLQTLRVELERHCPRCDVALYEFEFRHTPGVKLDACPKCKGIWVDDQELEALAQRPLPAAVAGTLAQRCAWVETVVEAALEGSREKFIQALALDGAVTNLATAAKLADDLLAAHAQFLPQFEN